MTSITRKFPIFKVTKNGEEVSVRVDKRSVKIESKAMQGFAGPPGADGLSSYEVWLSLGNVGTEQDFIDSLVGPSEWGVIGGDIETQADLMSKFQETEDLSIAYSIALG